MNNCFKKTATIITLIIFLISLLSFKIPKNETINNAQIIEDYNLDELYNLSLQNSRMTSDNLREINSYLKNPINDQYSDKWRVGLIEHRIYVNYDESSAQFYRDKIITVDTQYVTPSGLQNIELTSKTKFSTNEIISTTQEVKLAGESTIGFGVAVPNVNLTTQQKIQSSYNFSNTIEYSTNFENEKTYKLTYDAAKINIPANSSIAIGTVGDYFEFNVYIREEKYFWWGTEYEYEYKSMRCRIYTFTYKTFIFSDGTHDAKVARPY